MWFQGTAALFIVSFKVMAATADGASTNRRLFKLHSPSDKEFVYKVTNPYSISEKRELFFFSVPPHLIKTVRNAWASKKRQLWVGSYAHDTNTRHMFNIKRGEPPLRCLPWPSCLEIVAQRTRNPKPLVA